MTIGFGMSATTETPVQGESNSGEPGGKPVTPTRFNGRYPLTGLLIAAFCLRLVAAFAVEDFVRSEGRAFLIEGDANGYWELACNLVTGRPYAIHEPPRYVLRMPGFPLFLAAVIQCFGESTLAARILLAVAGTACCWLTWLLGCQVYNRRIGFWAALFMALHPFHIGNSVLILSETLFTFWMLLSLLLLVQLIDRPSGTADGGNRPDCPRSPGSMYLYSGATGVSIGLAILVRPGFLPWLVVAFGVLFVCLQTCRPRKAMAALCMFAGCAVLMFPWTLRNYRVTGHWVLTSLWSGPSLYDGLNPTADGSSDMRFFDEENVMVSRQMTEHEMNRHYTRRAIEFIRQNPRQTARLAIAKVARFLNPVPNAGKEAGWGVWGVCWAMWLFMLGFAVAGVRYGQISCSGLVATLGPFLLFLLVHMVFVGSVRYRLPVEFPLSVLTAIGWQKMVLSRLLRTEVTA